MEENLQQSISIWMMLPTIIALLTPISLFIYFRFIKFKKDQATVWEIPTLDFLIFLWLIVMAFISAPLLGSMITGQEEGETPSHLNTVIITVATHSFLICCFFLSGPLIKKNFFGIINVKAISIGNCFKYACGAYLLGLPIYFLANMSWVGLLSLVQSTGTEVDMSQQILVTTVQEAPSSTLAIILGLSGIILAPISEELVFRGAIYRFFKSSFNTRVALIISAALFAALHSNLLTLFPLFIMGLFFGIAYEKSGNILVPIFYHSVFNSVSVAILMLSR